MSDRSRTLEGAKGRTEGRVALHLRINNAERAQGVHQTGASPRRFLGYSFWVAAGGVIKRRIANKAMDTMKERVRQITRRSGGRSLKQVAENLRSYLVGWKNYFRLADTPGVFRMLDEWIRHRLRTLQLKQWKRGRTIFRKLRARGMSEHAAARVAANARRWCRNGRMAINIALPNRFFDELGVPRLGA